MTSSTCRPFTAGSGNSAMPKSPGQSSQQSPPSMSPTGDHAQSLGTVRLRCPASGCHHRGDDVSRLLHHLRFYHHFEEHDINRTYRPNLEQQVRQCHSTNSAPHVSAVVPLTRLLPRLPVASMTDSRLPAASHLVCVVCHVIFFQNGSLPT